MSTNKRKFKLEKSKDWDAWLFVIKSKVIVYQIWNKNDFSIIIKSNCLQKFQTVQKLTANIIAIDFNVYTTYKFEFIVYKIEMIEWKKQHEDFSKIIDVIHDIVSLFNLTYIQKKEMHFWNLLKVLKARLTSLNSARIIKLEKKYTRFMKKSFNRQKMKTWLNNYV